MFETFFTIRGLEEGSEVVRGPGSIDGQPMDVMDMTGVTVVLADHSETVQALRLRRCRVFIAASCNSVFLRNCIDCEITMACKQLRTRDCQDCKIWLYSKTDPIIETSTRIQFGPFTGASPQLGSLFRAAGLDPEFNHWRQVFDFNKDDESVPRPHWTFMDERDQARGWVVTIDGQPSPENPVPHTAAAHPPPPGPVLPGGGGGGFAAFDIRTTSQASAEAAVARMVHGR